MSWDITTNETSVIVSQDLLASVSPGIKRSHVSNIKKEISRILLYTAEKCVVACVILNSTFIVTFLGGHPLVRLEEDGGGETKHHRLPPIAPPPFPVAAAKAGRNNLSK